MFVCQVVSDFANFNLDDSSQSVCVACVCVCVCVPLASDSPETVEVTIVNLGTVTALDKIMQGHTRFSHENNKCLIISETL